MTFPLYLLIHNTHKVMTGNKCYGTHRRKNSLMERRENLNEQKLSGMKSRGKEGS